MIRCSRCGLNEAYVYYLDSDGSPIGICSGCIGKEERESGAE